jgi:hypothetical protein
MSAQLRYARPRLSNRDAQRRQNRSRRLLRRQAEEQVIRADGIVAERSRFPARTHDAATRLRGDHDSTFRRSPARLLEPLGVLVVNRLARHGQRPSDLTPRPTVRPGVFDLELFELLEALSQLDDRSERPPGFPALCGEFRQLHDALVHVSHLGPSPRLRQSRLTFRFAPVLRGNCPEAAMNFLKIISKRIRRHESGVQIAGDVNAVVSANVGERGSVSHVSSRQRSRVVQRSGRRDGDETRADSDEAQQKRTP